MTWLDLAVTTCERSIAKFVAWPWVLGVSKSSVGIRNAATRAEVAASTSLQHVTSHDALVGGGEQSSAWRIGASIGDRAGAFCVVLESC